MSGNNVVGVAVGVFTLVIVVATCARTGSDPLDEAMRAGRSAASFPAADEDYFHDMDGGVALTPDEVKGRNTWIVWTGGQRPLLGRHLGGAASARSIS